MPVQKAVKAFVPAGEAGACKRAGRTVCVLLALAAGGGSGGGGSAWVRRKVMAGMYRGSCRALFRQAQNLFQTDDRAYFIVIIRLMMMPPTPAATGSCNQETNVRNAGERAGNGRFRRV